MRVLVRAAACVALLFAVWALVVVCWNQMEHIIEVCIHFCICVFLSYTHVGTWQPQAQRSCSPTKLYTSLSAKGIQGKTLKCFREGPHFPPHFCGHAHHTVHSFKSPPTNTHTHMRPV